MSAIFEFHNVTKSFGKEIALRDFSLSAERGSVIALLGENGAGKTTALKILLGLIPPTVGKSLVHGLSSWTHGDDIRHRVGYVPDQPALYDWMTVEEIGWYCGGFYPEGFIDRFRNTLSVFEVPLKKRIQALSKGMKAKVSLALGMAHEPELLVLDEPTSGLDPIVRREFLESMVEVAASNRTVLLSSHMLQEVERVADTVAIIKDGKLQVHESLDTLKQDVSELTITLRNGSNKIPEPPGEVIHRMQLDRQWKLLVRNCPEQQLDNLRQSENVGHVEYRIPSLEDIYVGFMKSDSKAISATQQNQSADGSES